MCWKFWRPPKTEQPSASSIEPLSGWRVAFGETLSKDYSATRIMLVFTIVASVLFAPVKPWEPKKEDLHEIIGNPHFERDSKSGGSSRYFFVNDESFHCSFPALAGPSACTQFEARIDTSHPVKVTYFWTKNRIFLSAKILNSLEQDGKMVISPSDSLRLRDIIFQREQRTSWILPSLFGFITLLAFLFDRSRIVR
ncbi:MAG: hypothetical protein Q7T29_01780 [Gallionella sp.]|nr:hypothetical protein [Gallionella sp.]